MRVTKKNKNNINGINMSPHDTSMTATLPSFGIQTQNDLKDALDRFLTKKNGYKPSNAMKLVMRLLANIEVGSLQMTLPNGSVLNFKGNEDGPDAKLIVHNDKMARRFLTGGALGFCESYLDDDWSSPDITEFFMFILLNSSYLKRKLLGKKWVRIASYLAHKLKPNTRRGSRKNIYSHYDIGNDFYTQWLDKSMTYSSAYFADGIETLEAAQERKYAEMVKRLDLKPEHSLLEIGCGWGGFAEYVARNVGCAMTCITVSQAQYDYAVKRIEDAGLANKVEIRLQDYRDVSQKFDRIASIEMFEAVGEKFWPVYFNAIRNRLKSGGRAVLQIITINNKDFPIYRKSADFIQRYIFPGGMLPSMNALDEQIERAGLRKGDVLSFGQDYARTLQMWNEDFQDAWPNIREIQKMDERFKRMWELYLCYCEAGFKEERIDVIQIAAHKD